jgi:hypothetical protein
VVSTHEVERFVHSFHLLRDFIITAIDTSPTLSPIQLLPSGMTTDSELKNDIRIALRPVGIKYEEILLAAMQKHVAGMKVDK